MIRKKEELQILVVLSCFPSVSLIFVVVLSFFVVFPIFLSCFLRFSLRTGGEGDSVLLYLSGLKKMLKHNRTIVESLVFS